MPEQICWLCPVCGDPLAQTQRTLRCTNRHSFDLAKEGYCNLLLASRMRSKNPGDDKAMLRARAGFLNAGHYRPLADAIVDILAPHLPSGAALLDCGCGDGYYAEAVHQALEPTLRGIDIAREGVRMAARRFKRITGPAFAVASTFDMPVPDAAFDAALQVFAPVSETELMRVLKPDGVYCAVFPGQQHLMALKEVMYEQTRGHKEPTHAEGFTLLEERRVTFEMNLRRNTDIQNLLAMTPLNWKGSREGKAQLRAMNALDVGADFVVRLYRR
ncbi:MAG: methyltransferase domain-containing protein [Myxococcales bacterium]|nr:methyltransferase domain-containing protein [Myxococcales bacterium]